MGTIKHVGYIRLFYKWSKLVFSILPGAMMDAAVTQALFGEKPSSDENLRAINEAIADAFEFFGRRAAGGIAIPECVLPTDFSYPPGLQYFAISGCTVYTGD